MRNTYLAGTYQLQLTTSADGTPKYSNAFQIGGGSITSPTVQVSPTSPGTAASYTLSFYTSTNGATTSGNTISIQFPSGTTFTTASGTVQVGGSYGTYVASGYTVTITVMSSIAASSPVQILPIFLRDQEPCDDWNVQLDGVDLC